jgi:DNA-binding LacI/PurR family transcriptional regulator
VCGNDGRALQLLAACRARKLRVPRDLAVIGFDNHHEGALASPGLTTVDQCWRRQGQEAVAVLLRAAEDPAREPEDVVIAPALVERASV